MYFYILLLILVPVNVQSDSIKNSKDVFAGPSSENTITKDEATTQQDKVKIEVYYESLCPGSKYFMSSVLSPTVIQLSQYLNIKLYPYGHAKTTEINGHYEFECQHGTLECYGNKLHACAIDILTNMTQSVLFNGCMMAPADDEDGSDDLSADRCGRRMKIDSAPIKECAKGVKGSTLLKKYGDETKIKHLHYVPYRLINGKVNFRRNKFFNDTCAAFVSRPSPCSADL